MYERTTTSFLSLMGQLPARLNAEQAAWVLNCQPHDIPVLVSVRLLKPLGNPKPTAVNYFATLDLLEAARDRAFLAKITDTICQHWQKLNQAKRSRVVDSASSKPELPTTGK